MILLLRPSFAVDPLNAIPYESHWCFFIVRYQGKDDTCKVIELLAKIV
jgi:hypothetical protein